MPYQELGQAQVQLSNELWKVFKRAGEIAKEREIFPTNVDCMLLALLENDDVKLAFLEAGADPQVVERNIKSWFSPNTDDPPEAGNDFNFESPIGTGCIKKAYELRELFCLGTNEITLPLWFLAMVNEVRENDPETVEMFEGLIDFEELEKAAILLTAES
ncbi:MAG: hypothetical protein Q7S79_00445 [bacterium]|nr:hypothetical protein [bacterium]